jgi:uncharacterized membrane protein
LTNFHIVLKLIHILGAMVLFGTGLGIAFFMVVAHRTRDAALIAHTARTVVIADAVFTAMAVIVQPVSGAALIWLLGYSWREPWIVGSLALYLLAGLCWLPVVWIQVRLRDLAAEAARRGEAPSAEYRKLFRIWFALGGPAFLSVIAIVVLMIAKPS